MSEIIVLAPSRGRPDRAIEMWRSLSETAELPTTRLVLVVDHDDPAIDRYPPRSGFRQRYGWDPDAPFVVGLPLEETGNLTRATNAAARRFWQYDAILGHVGDDHLFRTPGWDRRIAVALATPGIAYGDDRHRGAGLPTAVFMSAVIPRTLGWYALPGTRHLYIDRVWKVLGEQLGVLHYLPDVVIEHMHPNAGKAETDEGYRLANSRDAYAHDRAVYRRWVADGMRADVARVRTELKAAAA